MTDKERIRILKEENRRLRRENEYLRFGASLPKGNTEAQKILAEKARQRAALHAKTYFGYLLEKFRRSRLFVIYDKTRFAMRGFLLARKLFHLFLLIATALGIGAQFLLSVSALAVFIPAATAVSLTVGIYGYFAYRKENRRFALYFDTHPTEKIYLFFLTKSSDSMYFERWQKSLTQENTVFLITDSFWKTGFGGVKKQKNGVYLLHSSYYFSLIRLLPQERLIKVH